MHLNRSTDINLVASDSTEIECVNDFKYLGGYTDVRLHGCKNRSVMECTAFTAEGMGSHPSRKETKNKSLSGLHRESFCMAQIRGTLNVARRKTSRRHIYQNVTCRLQYLLEASPNEHVSVWVPATCI